MSKVLVVGYGNPLRSDDGVGPRTAERIDALGLPGVDVRTAQQLNIELAGDLRYYDAVVLIDASAEDSAVSLRKVEPETQGGTSSTHHLSPAFLAALCVKLYGFEPNLHVCAIRGESFEMGETMTAPMQERMETAVRRIERFIREHAAHGRRD